MPINTPFVSILDFEAEPNNPNPDVRRRNSKAFKDAQDEMQNDFVAWGHPLFVPSGTFYLAEDLHIRKSLELFGTGVQGESILSFPEIFKITDEALACLTAAGIPDETAGKMRSLLDNEYLDRDELMEAAGKLLGADVALAHQAEILRCAFVRGTSLIIDPGTDLDPASSGANCVIRDLQIVSEEAWMSDDNPFDKSNFHPPTFEGTSKGTPGIKMHSTAVIQRVYIKGFTGTGIYVLANGDQGDDANYWRMHDVYVESCGGHGIHVDGGDAQGGLCTGAKMIVLGGSGIVESSFGGNTYVGCYVFVAKGRGYASDSVGQATFVGCLAEADQPIRLHAVDPETGDPQVSGHVWVGGGAVKTGFTDDTDAFIAESYWNVHPFEVPNLRNPEIKLLVGYPNNAKDPTTLCAWKNNNGGEFYVMRWDMDNKIWTIENGSVLPDQDDNGKFLRLPELPLRQIATYLTGQGYPRGPWLQGFGEILLGPPNKPVKISYGGRPEDLSGEPGDIVYLDLRDANPEEVSHIGYVCIGADRKWRPFGKIDEDKLPA